MVRTPDTIFPSDNDYGIPRLDLKMQGDYIDLPCLAWGSTRRRKRGVPVGTWHFYVDDYRFNAVWNDPEPIIDSGAVSIVEVNYTTGEYTSNAQALWHTYQKRWLSRYWQTKGIRIFVDLFVEERLREINLLGVPKEWRAYASRYQFIKHDGSVGGFPMLLGDYFTACNHHGSEDIIFVVMGGRQNPVEKFCAENGWFWIPDSNLTSRGLVS